MPDLGRLISRTASPPVEYEPFEPAVYAALPRVARRLQRGFYREIQSWRARRLPVQTGEILVVVPARNEARGIERTLEGLRGSVGADRAIEIAVVDNGSRDGTAGRVRAWAAAHASEVDLVDHAAGSGPRQRHAVHRPRDGRLRVHLLEQPRPGKVSAVLAAERLLTEYGRSPEWIAQVDADTSVAPGSIRGLAESAAAQGQVAATGAPREVRWDGTAPASFDAEAPGTPPGGWPRLLGQNLNGGFFVARTAAYFAGYRTIEREFPETTTEDAVLSAMFRMVGLKTGAANPDHPFTTLGAGSEADARARLVRLRTGSILTARAFGSSMLARIGHTTSWNETIDLDALRRDWAGKDASRHRWIDVMREALDAANKARAEKPGTWEPAR